MEAHLTLHLGLSENRPYDTSADNHIYFPPILIQASKEIKRNYIII